MHSPGQRTPGSLLPSLVTRSRAPRYAAQAGATGFSKELASTLKTDDSTKPATTAAAGLTSTEQMASMNRSSEPSPAIAAKHQNLLGHSRKSKQPS